ncbi:hypothetical protein A9Q84_13645 [Halobacteriovorax marinus]|uniref:Uncharacterized protein n=1 Tax=Halobacteriovorax marinus TaxID=97084 RepID=A0A1Y5F905_9BACT|nr:hypothetical protein A9Q84_13645 [Halobacteriovorax marinus]
MYKVTLTKKCANSLAKLKKENLISKDDLLIIKTWINEMVKLGPEYIQICEYWNDHKLTGAREDERSSSFSFSGRIIYRIKKSKIEISVIKITTDHDYS